MGKPINEGDYVRWICDGQPAGKVVGEYTQRYLELEDDHGEPLGVWPEEGLELAPPPKPTPAQAWKEATFEVLELMKAHPCGQYIVPTQYSSLRHQMYVILGGAGIKVTNEVKREVRQTIKRCASLLNLTVIED